MFAEPGGRLWVPYRESMGRPPCCSRSHERRAIAGQRP
jgi:hypothetical protein